MIQNLTVSKQPGIVVFLACLFSAVLLVVSFPRLEFSFLAWVALLPLLCKWDGVGLWRAFRRGWLFGFLFFGLELGWLCYVTPIGTVLLAAFLALYVALFGVSFVYFRQRLGLIPRLLILSCVWVALEYIRGHFLSGFGWVMLGYTQSNNIWLIQIVDTVGVYGISFLVMLVNLLVFETWRAKRLLAAATTLVAVVIAAVLCYGWYTVSHTNEESEVRVGVVQPNISLKENWDANLKPAIVDETLKLTGQLKDDNLDLIVWPEASLPGMVDDDFLSLYKIRSTAAHMQVPFVIGSTAQEGDKYFNSAFYINADGQMKGRYDKIHLVPFGEYLPVRPLLGWINHWVPLDDFTSGKTYRIFTLAPSVKFGVLICFEDTLSDLCRRMTLMGANFFVNITNDAWFKNTREPFLHLKEAVFGCVENHRGLVCAANTGLSALIDPWGRITMVATDAHGQKLFVEATGKGTLPVRSQLTFYTKYGDIFTYLCFLCILVASVLC